MSFNISLANNAMWQINKLGVILSEKEVKTIKTTSLKSNEVIYFLMDSVPKFDTLNWISAGFYFTATTKLLNPWKF